MTQLFRPLGLQEMSLLWDSEFREFPPRLVHQPFFYPVVTADYARHIAAHWNVNDEASGFVGFVTRFAVADDYLAAFERHVVGARNHVEYWIPSEQLPSFNHALTDPISVDDAFFGPKFVGHVPHMYGLKGKDAIQQFVILAGTWDYSRMDFVCEVSANRKAVYLNSWFWAQHDFTDFGIGQDQKHKVMGRLQKAWEFNQITFLLPLTFRENAKRIEWPEPPG